MADASSDTTPSGFVHTDDGYFPDPTSQPPQNLTGDPTQDFAGMSWQYIEAAIVGGGSMSSGGDQQSTANGLVNPASVQGAANVFKTVAESLAVVARSLNDQTNALAGPDGPWQGDAATSFVAMMQQLINKIQTVVNQINDGDGLGNNSDSIQSVVDSMANNVVGGSRNVPNQLANAASMLSWAQNAIAYIDDYYANQVIARGAVLPDGRAEISAFPQAVEMMTSDMRAVGDTLATSYNSFSIASPISNSSSAPPPSTSAVPPPSGGGAGLSGPATGLPSAGGAGLGGGSGSTSLANPDLSALPVGATSALGAGGTGLGNGSTTPFSSASVPSAPLSSPSALPSSSSVPISSASIPPAPSADAALGAVPTGTSASLDSVQQPAVTGPTLGDGSSGLGSLVPPIVPAGVGGSDGIGGLGAGGKANDQSSPTLSGAPQDSGLGPAGAPGLATDGSAASNPGIAPAEIPTSVNDTKAGVAGSAAPMMPPAGMGGVGGNPSANERPDSAGLLGGVAAPWTPGAPSGLGDPSLSGASPALVPAAWASPGTPGAGDAGQAGAAPAGVGAERAEAPAVSSGMPMMPPGTGLGANGNSPGNERPDSAGLLGGVDTPWASDVPGGVGDPSSSGETPALAAASWAPTPDSGLATPADTNTAPAASSNDTVSPQEFLALAELGTLAAAAGTTIPPSTATAVPSEVVATGTLAPSGGLNTPWAASGNSGVGDPDEFHGTLAGPEAEVAPAVSDVPSAATGGETDGVRSASSGTTPADHPDAGGVVAPGGWARNSGWGTGSADWAAQMYEHSTPDSPPASLVAQPASGGDDSAAWDLGSAELLGGLVTSAALIELGESTGSLQGPRGIDGPDAEESGPKFAVYQRLKSGEGVPFSGGFLSCGAGALRDSEDSEEETELVDEFDEDSEAEERTMADLLSQDGAAWSRVPNAPTGVLE